ncbi:MAG: hypothetical protein JHD16_05110 [Solirubrobacteraceae bacterium]|nr:hypothetical protein [Solirubrobacteraceae bacterium]
MEYSDQTLHLSDLATLEGVNYVIEDSEFTNCIMRGPAVVMLERTSASSGEVTIPNQDADTVIVVAEEGRRVVPVGVVVIRGCTFAGCTFENVSFFGPSSQMDGLRETFMSNVAQ